MILNYIAPDRMDIMRDVRECTQHMQKPTLYDERCVKHVVRYLMGAKEYGVLMPWPDPAVYDPGAVELTTWVDTDWATDKSSRKSLCCYEVLADNCILHGSVKQQSFLALSSGEAEFGGIHTASAESLLFKRLFEWLEMRVLWKVKTDSSAGRAMCLRQGVGRVRHLDLRLLWSQQAVAHLGLRVEKCEGPRNRADLGTKKHTASEHIRLRALAGIVPFDHITQQAAVNVHAVAKSSNVQELKAALLEVISKMV